MQNSQFLTNQNKQKEAYIEAIVIISFHLMDMSTFHLLGTMSTHFQPLKTSLESYNPVSIHEYATGLCNF